MMSNMKAQYKLKKFHSQFHDYQYSGQPGLKYNPIKGAEGLRKAYAHGDYYIHGKTMFIAGSHTARDWFDDVTKVPAWGD